MNSNVGETLCGLPKRNSNIFERKKIRLSRSIYEEKGRPFSITICTANKQKIFQKSNYAKSVLKSVVEGTFFSKCDCMAVCLMPDHVHLLIAPIQENLINLLGGWKSYTTNLLHFMGYQGMVWQRSFYDHALRKDEDVKRVAEYIVNNPVRAGFVKSWKDYEYSWYKWMEWKNHERPQGIAPTYVYPYKDELYLNITSRCPTACKFCIKFSWEFKYRGHNLLLKREPSVKEVLALVGDPSRYSEIVFCGYGESTYRLKEMEKISIALKKRGAKKIRLNTVGLGNLIHGRDIVPELARFLDAISISLNTVDPEEWVKVHRPRPEFKERGFESVVEFIRKCAKAIPETYVTALDMPGVDLKKIKKFVEQLGAKVRVRPYLDKYESR